MWISPETWQNRLRLSDGVLILQSFISLVQKYSKTLLRGFCMDDKLLKRQLIGQVDLSKI